MLYLRERENVPRSLESIVMVILCELGGWLIDCVLEMIWRLTRER